MMVVGLGNPVPKYAGTRHNIGLDFVDFMAQRASASKPRRSHGAEIFDIKLVEDNETPPVKFSKLSCYMNESGPILRNLLSQETVGIGEILIILDDFMIPFGSLRWRQIGSSGGHNGLQSIIESFGTEEFERLRVGVGPVYPGQDPAQFVLQRFTGVEQQSLPYLYKAIGTGLLIRLMQGFEKAATFTNQNHI